MRGRDLRGPLQLDDELRSNLRLEAEESVHVLQVGPRTLLLGRSGPGGAPAVPWDRDLVLTADVRAFALADLLQLIHEARKSGFLYFTQQDHVKCVYLHQGEVVFASSNQRVDRLGECLLRAGVLTLEQLREAERRFEGEGRFGKVLVERGLLTPRELWNGVKYQVEETVRSLFSYTAGVVHFWAGEVQPDNVVRLSLPTGRLVEEGLQRRDELLRFLAVLEDSRMRVAPVDGGGARLSGNERTLFDALERHPFFPELCRHIGLDPLTAARAIQLLRLVGSVQLMRVRDEAAFLGAEDLRAHDEEAVRESVARHVKLLAELAAPLVALDGARDFSQRVARVLDDVRVRHLGLLRDVEVGPYGELDPALLVEQALRLPGERVSAVAGALGELVAYLEFELRNHPRIPNADDFLSDLDELR
ncbi:MAG: DUF4388 domain-containing protein [Myxococcota bacterium]